MPALTLHTTRGTLNPATLDEARALHNAFVSSGPHPGIEIARSLGDISHNIYIRAPAAGGDPPAATAHELLFVDFWSNPEGMETFFANPSAQHAAQRLFCSREESEWTPAPGAFTFAVPAPAATAARVLAMTQAPVSSLDDAIAPQGKLAWDGLSGARRHGQLSHTLFVRPAAASARPASNARHGAGKTRTGPAEILIIDTWLTPRRAR